MDPLDFAELREIELDKDVAQAKKWTSLLQHELKFNISQAHDLLELQDRVNLTLKNVQAPLVLAQENRLTRQKLQIADNKPDAVEKCLLREVETLQSSEEILQGELEKLNVQLRNLREARNQIENDIATKKEAQRSEECAELLQTLIQGKAPLVQATAPGPGALTGTTKTTATPPWLNTTKELIKKSQTERNSTRLLFASTTRKMITAADASFSAWYETNSAFDKRIRKMTAAKQKLESQLDKNKTKIEGLKCQRAKIERFLGDKRQQLQLVQNKLEKRRGDATEAEMCRDKTLFNLLRDIQTIQVSIDKQNQRQEKNSKALEELVKATAVLERDLKLKTAALRTDRDKCLLLRQIFPISTFTNARFPNPKA